MYFCKLHESYCCYSIAVTLPPEARSRGSMKSRKQSRIIVALNGLTFIVWLLLLNNSISHIISEQNKHPLKMQTYFFYYFSIKLVTSFWDWVLKWKVFFRSVDETHWDKNHFLSIQSIWIKHHQDMNIDWKYLKCFELGKSNVWTKVVLLPQCAHWSICHLAVALFKR